jgi:hypothetical protein
MEYTEFDEDDIYSVARIIATKVAMEPITASKRRLVAVRKKFENAKYLKVSTELPLPSAAHIPGRFQF